MAKTRTKKKKSRNSGGFKLPWQRQPPEEQVTRVPFEKQCSCGTVLMGVRRAGGLIVLCDHCQQSSFILPADPFPDPGEVRTASRRVKTAARSIGQRVLGGGYALGVRLRRMVARGVGAIQSFLLAIWGWFTPFRTVVLAGLLLAAMTAWYGFQQAALNAAEQRLLGAAERAEELLANGDMPAAASAFQEAATAIRTLGRTDDRARRLLQAARETEALVNLSADAIPAMLDRVARAAAASPEATFDTLYAGKYLLLDGPVVWDADTATMSLWHASGPVIVLLPRLPADAGATTGGRVLVAGRLQALRKEAAGWTIELQPESSFLWGLWETLPEVLREDGPWSNTAHVQDTLAAQRQLLELAP